MKYSLLSFVLAIGIAAAVGQPKDSEPLSLARQGYLFTGGKYSNDNNPRAMSGQLYVEFQIPSRQTHRWPIVMIHGGAPVERPKPPVRMVGAPTHGHPDPIEPKFP